MQSWSDELAIDGSSALRYVQLSPSTESRLELLVQAAESLGIENPSLIASVPFILCKFFL